MKTLKKQIKNPSDYPSAEWLDDPKLIGSVGPDQLYLVGHEYTDVEPRADYALVAVDYPGQDYLAPIELYSLLGASQEVVNVNESLLD